MGLKTSAKLLTPLLLLYIANAHAAPMLRLTGNAVGPVSVPVGGTASFAQSLRASNAGDGSLRLTLTSSAAWLTASAGAQTICGIFGACIPLSFTVNAAGLQKGAYTAVVTVSDPNAIDSPQFIRVTARVGTGIPDRLDLYAAPGGGPVSATVYGMSSANATASTASGGSWLTVSRMNIDTAFPYTVTANPGALAQGDYNGTVTIAGAATPVTLHIAPQPVAVVPANPVVIRIAANAKPVSVPVAIGNSGTGTLAVTGATAAGGDWLSASTSGNVVTITGNPEGVAPGVYDGTVAVASNAANASTAIPVVFNVLAAGAPLAYAQGAVNNATFESGDFVAPGGIVAIFGEQFVAGDPAGAAKVPLDTTLGTTRVYVNDVAAPLYYAGYGQVNFQVPYETPAGTAIVRVERDGQTGNKVSMRVIKAAPRILRVGIGDYGVILNQDGSLVAPAGIVPGSHPAKAGDVLVIYAIDLGQTTPPAVTGAAATSDPLLKVPNYTVELGGAGWFSPPVVVPAQFAGLSPGSVGLYQINFQVPANARKGATTAAVVLGDDGPSNRVVIAIE